MDTLNASMEASAVSMDPLIVSMDLQIASTDASVGSMDRDDVYAHRALPYAPLPP